MMIMGGWNIFLVFTALSPLMFSVGASEELTRRKTALSGVTQAPTGERNLTPDSTTDNESPALNRFNCHVTETSQLTEGGQSQREVQHNMLGAFIHLINLLTSLDNLGILKFEQNIDEKRNYVKTKSLWQATIFVNLDESSFTPLLFRPLLQAGQVLLHNSRRLRIREGDKTFQFCLFEELELISEECTLTLEKVCQNMTWVKPGDPEIKSKSGVLEILAEDATSRISWVNLGEEPKTQEFVGVARHEAELLWDLQDIILGQLGLMLEKISIFNPLISQPPKVSCNYWLWEALLRVNNQTEKELSQENTRTQESLCQGLESRIGSIKRGKRSLFGWLFNDHSQEINSLFHSQNKMQHAANILIRNQHNLIHNLRNVQSNLKSIEDANFANFESLEKTIKIVQSREHFHQDLSKQIQSRLSFASYFHNVYSQIMQITQGWKSTLNDLLSESESNNRCNLAPAVRRVICKQGRGFLKEVNRGQINTVTRGKTMNFKKIFLPQCLPILSGGEERIFKGNYYGFISSEKTWVHENLTVPSRCLKEGGSLEELHQCDRFLTDLKDVRYKPQSKDNQIYYLLVNEGLKPGVFLQSKNPVNIVGVNTSESIHSEPTFYPQDAFPLHVGKKRYLFSDFNLQHESFSHKFFLELIEPGYFRHTENIRVTSSDLERASLREMLAEEIRNKLLSSDPAFLSSVSVSGFLFLCFMILLVCCIKRKCCNSKELKTNDYISYYREQARKAKKSWFSIKGQNKETEKVQDHMELHPFTNASAPKIDDLSISSGRVPTPGQRLIQVHHQEAGGARGIPVPKPLPKPEKGKVRAMDRGQVETYLEQQQAARGQK